MKWEGWPDCLFAFGLCVFLQTLFVQNVAAQNQPAPAPFGRHTENVNGVPFELVRVPAGSFLMGNDRSPNPEEKPAHQVNLRSFYMGRYEVTRQQWNIVATTLPQVSLRLRTM